MFLRGIVLGTANKMIILAAQDHGYCSPCYDNVDSNVTSSKLLFVVH